MDERSDDWSGPVVLKANKREIPGSIPPMLWYERILDLEKGGGILEIPWYHPVMELLPPQDLRRMKAKALVWYEQTGEWPGEVAWWWEIRQGRRNGHLPHTAERVEAHIDKEGTLHCGYCEAKWSANSDGSPHPDRCKLCDRVWSLVHDDRISI